MPTPRRYLAKFQSKDQLLEYEFPHLGYEYSEKQESRAPFVEAVGMNYGVDMLGFGQNILGPRTATVRFITSGDSVEEFDTNAENMIAMLRRIGAGRLWTNKGHWCWARNTDLPEMSYLEGNHLFMPSQPKFRLDSDWFAEDEEVQSFDVTGDIVQTVTVNNPGTIPVLAMQIDLQGNSSLGVREPEILNLQNGYMIGTERNTSYWVRIRTAIPAMEFSSNGGGTWSADYSNRKIGPNQANWMVLEPGPNTIQLTHGNTPNYTLTFTFFPAFMT